MKNPTTHPRPTAAFTLMEMMLVLLIISLIIGSVAVLFSNFSNTAQITTTEGKIRTIESGLTSYRTVNGRYPTQAQGIEALVTRPSTDPQPKRWSPLLKADGIIDAWDNKIQYRNPGKKNPNGYDVFSMGPDRVESADDIGNW
jgi:general secretion pathway protein G